MLVDREVLGEVWQIFIDLLFSTFHFSLNPYFIYPPDSGRTKYPSEKLVFSYLGPGQ